MSSALPRPCGGGGREGRQGGGVLPVLTGAAVGVAHMALKFPGLPPSEWQHGKVLSEKAKGRWGGHKA